MRRATLGVLLVIACCASLHAQDAVLEVMAEKSGMIAHMRVLEVEGGYSDEAGVSEWNALCEVVAPIKGDFVKKQKVQFRFNRFDFGGKKEPMNVEHGKEYVVFLDGKPSGGYRFVSQEKMLPSHVLVDRWLGLQAYEAHLFDRLVKEIIPNQKARAKEDASNRSD
jgi:hypothetical protein